MTGLCTSDIQRLQGFGISGPMLSCYFLTWMVVITHTYLEIPPDSSLCNCRYRTRKEQSKMALAGGRGFLVQPCISSSFVCKNIINKPLFGVKNTFWPARLGPTSRVTRTVVRAQLRPTWLPGLDPPPYLDGSLPGDYGFDPLGLGEDPQSLKWYVQAELVHSRFAMLGVAGILFTDLLRVTGIINLPLWYDAGAVKFKFANTETLFIVQLILMGFAETKRYMDFVSPGSQAEGPFLGMEVALEGLEPGTSCNGSHARILRASLCDSCRTN
ncbi:hypothetical protein I3843_16G045500 [Carya illinoinensis]|nr:hypothetical protein I3760_16G044400 [Carya illinoinensis]KAG7941478.1 hypothetical protein I3843_16G045500 [Carya illinoinensis]